MIYSDEDLNGKIRKVESLKDPLTNDYLYSFQCTKDNIYDKSKFLLISQEYDIVKVNISCNKTSTVGQLSFDINGELHSKLSAKINEKDKYKIIKPCTIEIIDKNNNYEIITIHDTTGVIE
jgi:hypothetical protein